MQYGRQKMWVRITVLIAENLSKGRGKKLRNDIENSAINAVY
jgi:hypothetical protein